MVLWGHGAASGKKITAEEDGAPNRPERIMAAQPSMGGMAPDAPTDDVQWGFKITV
jgi:hypothetical protein